MENETNFGPLDVIGTIYSAGETPTALPGWHVNSPWPIAAFAAQRVTPATPRRVFAGVPTVFYTFTDEAEFLALLGQAEFSTPVPVPQVVTRRQARQALLLAGVLSQVPLAIAAIQDPLQRGMVQIEWDDSQVFERKRPTLITLAAALGMNDEALDQLFLTASEL